MVKPTFNGLPLFAMHKFALQIYTRTNYYTMADYMTTKNWMKMQIIIISIKCTVF